MKRRVTRGLSRIRESIKRVTVRKSRDSGASLNGEATVATLPAESDWFDENFEIMEQIGKGGFATVFVCRKRGTAEKYAVKVVDIRPLRLKESFKPAQLQREVEIMKTLRHPNIIEFVGSVQREDSLLMVLEYAPGKELFEVIIEKQKFTESEAKPVFLQIAHAVRYLHSVDVLHRDIKPENILIVTNSTTGAITAKLLDFGLAKYSGMGSVARSFVGTPCYVAPEIEAAARAQGRTYGPAVDCWSLGTVLYVMLVARFPEFQYVSGLKTLVLSTSLWGDASEEAKHLVRGLIHGDPNARLTTNAVMRHPWLRGVRDANELVTAQANDSNILAMPPPGPVATMPVEVTDDHGNRCRSPPPPPKEGEEVMSMVKNPQCASKMRSALTASMNGLKVNDQCRLHLSSLLMLQKNIALCFCLAKRMMCSNKTGLDVKLDAAAEIMKTQITTTVKLLRKMDQTSGQVLHMFPDLQLAVDEQEGELAAAFFSEVSELTVTLQDAATQAQQATTTSLQEVKDLVEFVYDQAMADVSAHGLATMPSKADIRTAVRQLEQRTGGDEYSQQDLMGLFSTLFKVGPASGGSNSSNSQEGYTSNDTEAELDSGYVANLDSMLSSSANGSVSDGQDERSSTEDVCRMQHMPNGTSGGAESEGSYAKEVRETITKMNEDFRGTLSDTEREALQIESKDLKFCPLGYALQCLQKVGVILKQLNSFWASTETVLEVLTMKGRHAEKFISFAHNPKLMDKFKGRLTEYRQFWEGVSAMSGTYLQGITDVEYKIHQSCSCI